VKKMKLPFPVLSDDFKIVARRYGVAALPQVFFISQKGVILERVTGYGPKGFKKYLSVLTSALGREIKPLLSRLWNKHDKTNQAASRNKKKNDNSK